MKPSAPTPPQTSTAISDIEALYEAWAEIKTTKNSPYILKLIKQMAWQEWMDAEKTARKPKKITPN